MGQGTGDPVKSSARDHEDDDTPPMTQTPKDPAPVADQGDTKSTASATTDSRAQDILAMIRNRQK
jgi:hypothetical protein